jgi:hypothetical protein
MYIAAASMLGVNNTVFYEQFPDPREEAIALTDQ